MASLSDTNKKSYISPSAIYRYRKAERLFPAETRIFDLLSEELPRSRLLDIGIGTGRTTSCLLPRVSNYVGIDYAPALIERARELFPGADLRLQDARELDGYATDSFDIILFSYNGLDQISHDERIAALRQFHRILRPGGHLVFSAHNRACSIRAPHDLRHLQSAFNPRKTVFSIANYFVGLRNSIRMRPLEKHEHDYSIINDQAHAYALLTYYIHVGDQRDQLASIGFSNIRGFGMAGEDMGLSDRHPDSFMIYYLAEKPPGS